MCRIIFPQSKSRAFEKSLLTALLKAREAFVLSHLPASAGRLTRGARQGVEVTQRAEL